MSALPLELHEFAILGKWHEKLDLLEELAMPETWSFRTIRDDARNRKNPILANYLVHTYKKLAFDYNEADRSEKDLHIMILEEPGIACFNTGLFTSHYNPIFTFFRKYNSKWALIGFFEESSHEIEAFQVLPKRANYFSDMCDLLFDYSLELRVNASHILSDPENLRRIPDDFREHPNLTTFFNGAIGLAKKKVEANYKTAVPQYYCGCVQLLLPICLRNPQVTDLALVVMRNDTFYTGKTCLTIDMAYNNARLIARPDSDWLIP